MPVPAQPANLIPQPFAAEGTFQLIPDTQSASGRASFTLGFPPETQQPLREGGVAPNRTDFNGMFYMLSAFAFWQQSGGMWNYVATLNYAVPAVVYHNNILWWCVAPNGPDVGGIGTKEPGTDTDYWVEFIRALSGGGSGGLGNPVGTVLMFYGTEAPGGYFPCNAFTFDAESNPELFALLGNKNVTPDMRGLVPRCYDPTGKVDPQGATRAIGSIQTDAGRPVTGRVDWQTNSTGAASAASALYDIKDAPDGCAARTNGWGSNALGIDSTRCWGTEHTATEFRGANMNFLFCIKHD